MVARRRREHFDVVTRTERERREDDLRRRRRIYLSLMVPCILVFVVFGAGLLPVPMPVRIVVLCLAAVTPPVAAFLGNRKPW